jgi:hypothetical protein
MGYRSEVKSLIYGEPEAMAKFKSDNAELIEALALDYGSDLTQVNNGSYEIIYLDLAYSKWYDSFSEVIRWTNLLNLANEAELMTEFVRIGQTPRHFYPLYPPRRVDDRSVACALSRESVL